MIEDTLQVAQLASELETIKLMGVVLAIALFAVMFMVVIVSRNTQSQDKQNESTVSASFDIITKLVRAIDDLNTTVRDLSVSFGKMVIILQSIQSEQETISQKLDAVLAIILEPEQLQDLGKSDIEIPHITDEMEHDND